jgi:outer membrane receptor for ferrienterochelin and colicins
MILIFAALNRLLPIILLISSSALAQQSPDSLATKELEEVVVTATRNERNMGALPMPVTLVSKAQIKTHRLPSAK